MDITSIDSTTLDPEPSSAHPQPSSVLAHLAAILDNIRAFPVPTAIETADTIESLVALLVSQSPPSSIAIPAEPSINSVAAELSELKSLVSGLVGKLTTPSTPNVLSFATVASQQGGWNHKRPRSSPSQVHSTKTPSTPPNPFAALAPELNITTMTAADHKRILGQEHTSNTGPSLPYLFLESGNQKARARVLSPITSTTICHLTGPTL